MAARLGWNSQTVPNGMAWNAANDTNEANYDVAYSGNLPDIITGLFSLQGGVNRDGGGGAVVWTPTWLPVAADPMPDTTYFGSNNQFFKCTGGVSSPPINLYNGELQMRATLAGVPLDGYLRLVVTSDPDYGSAQWQWVSDAPPLVCDFEGDPLSGLAPLEVQFTDLSSGGSVADWLWSFGDAGSSTDQNPLHNYGSPGLYTVGLVINGGDANEEKIDYILVTGAPPAPPPSIGTAMNVLPVSRLIHVGVNLTPAGAQGQDLSTLLVMGTSSVIDTTERMRIYTRLEDIAADFGTSAEEYKAAVLWFEQVPQPSQLNIGRWVNASSRGGIRGATLNAASQLMSAWTGIANGSFTVTKDAGGPQNVTGLNFTGAANLNAVAAIIQAGFTGTTVVWNATYQRFEITSNTTGATSAISFLSVQGAGTDISALLGMRSTSSGAYLFGGQIAESAVAAVQAMNLAFNQLWYACVVPSAIDSDHLAIAAFLEGTNTKHFYGVTTQEAGVLVAADTSNIAYALKQLAYKKTMVQYSSSNPYAVVSALARILTTNYQGNSTVITLMYKQEPGIVAESINSLQADALESFNCNVFVNYDNNTAILEKGVTSSGIFADIVLGTDWLAVDLIKNLYNLLYTSLTKIPQTDAGTHLLVTTCEAVLTQAVINGLLAPGVWNSGGFGELRQGDYLQTGFYVYAPSVNTQDPADRAARKSVPIQIAAKLAGAVHEVFVSVLVNQ